MNQSSQNNLCHQIRFNSIQIQINLVSLLQRQVNSRSLWWASRFSSSESATKMLSMRWSIYSNCSIYSYLALSLILRLILVSHVTWSVIQLENSNIWPIIFKNSPTFNHMTATYAIIESCIQKTIDVINMYDNSNQVEIAREFDVLMQRLQFRLKDHSSASAIQELHNRALKSDQKLALHTYIKRLNELSLSASLNLIESADNLLLRQNSLWASLDLK